MNKLTLLEGEHLNVFIAYARRDLIPTTATRSALLVWLKWRLNPGTCIFEFDFIFCGLHEWSLFSATVSNIRTFKGNNMKFCSWTFILKCYKVYGEKPSISLMWSELQMNRTSVSKHFLKFYCQLCKYHFCMPFRFDGITFSIHSYPLCSTCISKIEFVHHWY
jgi:hypothetical protein